MRKGFYSIDKYQITLLWIFGAVIAALSYMGSFVEVSCSERTLQALPGVGTPCYDFKPSFSDLLGLLGVPFQIVFYTMGWRKNQDKEK